MHLKKLELYGFKSFAQRTEIIFNDGITGIVGPNGSGKSNIGDAVRWVLGEQSAKTLRGASMSDVIFNGTQKRKPLGYCEVSLVFDNEDRGLKSDFAEVVVTRRVYRNGDGEYYLNRTACRLKDIVDLFRDTGIGREGYSIIGQGRIDDILSRKSEDRRQVFEEAAGIVKYRARKEEADRKLERTLENAARIDDILEELKHRLGPLERQSRDAREYLELSSELKGLDLNLFLIRSDQYKQRLADLDTELMNLQTVLDDCEATLQEKTARRDECQEQIADLEEKITAARNGLLTISNDLHAAQSGLTTLQSRQSARAENRGRLQGEQETAVARVKQLEQLRFSTEEDMEAQRRLVTEGEVALETARGAAQLAQQAEEAADNALQEHKNAVLDAMNRLSAVRNDQTRLKTMRGQMEERLHSLEGTTADMRQEEERLSQAVTDAQALLEEEKQRQKECSQALEDARAAQQEAETRQSALRTNAEQLSAQLQSTQARWKLLDDMTREMDGFNQTVRRAVQYGKDRGIRGVKGVVAQLISVPEQYETALDMVLGAAQQNIVTDTEETAKQLIDYLRQNRFGRATFLPQSAIRSKLLNSNERRVLSMPGCLGVASELVSFAPEYREIVENLLGRTVIADNLDHGIAIMRAGGHSFRLVTLQGDVMHSGGSMTGGSAQSRMVNLFSREREVKELAQTLREGKTRLDAMKQKLAQGQNECLALREKTNDALRELHQQEIAVTRENERTDNAEQALTAHRERMEATAEAMTQLSDSIAEIDRDLSLVTQQHEDEETDQSAMEQETDRLQTVLFRAREDNRAAADLVMTRTLQLNDLRHTLEVMEHDSTRNEQDRAALEQACALREEQLRQMDEADAEDTREAESISAQIAQHQADLNRQNQSTSQLESRRGTFQETLRTVLNDMEALHETFTRDSDRHHRVELQRARCDNDLRTLQDRIWNTWELTYAGAEEFRVPDFKVAESEKRAAELNARIRALGNVNVNAVEEYAATKERYDELTREQEDIRKAEADLRKLISDLLENMRTNFTDSFSKLQVYFSETFTRLFGGGHAELKLTDPNDPLNCGIEINAQPPGKKLQLLSLLSGGERALCAIAILFAMLKLKPTPFCILDEIEAALDDANIGYYADYLLEYSKDTQFIVVTHRKGTMERCDSLYGVSMQEQGVSSMMSVSLQDYEE